MYGYRIKHKIFKEFLNDLAKEAEKIEPNMEHSISLVELCKRVNKRKYLEVGGYVTHMALEGYFEMTDVPDTNEDMMVSITPKGIKTALGENYKIKQNVLFWKSTMNIALTVANVFVAITAIWALTKDGDETQKLKDRLEKIEKTQGLKSVITNPNTLHLQNSNQAIPKNDSLVNN